MPEKFRYRKQVNSGISETGGECVTAIVKVKVCEFGPLCKPDTAISEGFDIQEVEQKKVKG
jgi:hypothetical protein